MEERTMLKNMFKGQEAQDEKFMMSFIAYARMQDDLDDDATKELHDSYLDVLVDHGNPQAYVMKADEFLQNDEDSESVQNAFNHYLQAAMNGEWFGLECIAEMFFEGKGVEQNYIMAYRLLRFVLEYAPNPNQLSYYIMGKIVKEGYIFPRDLAFCEILVSKGNPYGCRVCG